MDSERGININFAPLGGGGEGSCNVTNLCKYGLELIKAKDKYEMELLYIRQELEEKTPIDEENINKLMNIFQKMSQDKEYLYKQFGINNQQFRTK